MYLIIVYSSGDRSLTLGVVYVLLGRAVTEYRWGGSRNIPFTRHKFLVL